ARESVDNKPDNSKTARMVFFIGDELKWKVTAPLTWRPSCRPTLYITPDLSFVLYQSRGQTED
ncbi:MAG TPA: hypothetical protein VFT65_17130, partial [Candidatus Angelobacter sp.]|nr:hypothetical protein [Candidatus Angelobacter sp.]